MKVGQKPVLEHTKAELVDLVLNDAQPGTPRHERNKMAVIARCTADLEVALQRLEISMNTNAEASHVLARKVFWLYVFLAIATAVGGFVGVVQVFG